jgi:hypothetical protein
MHKEQLIREALGLPTNVISYSVSQILAERFPNKAILEGDDTDFDVGEYAEAQLCTVQQSDAIHNQVATYWVKGEIDFKGWIHNTLRLGGSVPSTAPSENSEEEDRLVDSAHNTWLRISWRDITLEVLVMEWHREYNRVRYFWIIADTQEIAREFMQEVCRWNAEIRGEVLVYSGSCWRKDARLFRAIKNSTFDNLILKGDLKEDIQQDLIQFFASRSTYEMYGIPWKRGILFIGLPGNGKTHAVKAIINAMGHPCLYVKSFHAEHSTDEDNIREVFERARKSAPCILVLEDLDSLLTPQNRAFFLNELDGFAANIGIVTIATTNHPERLDPAILDRPSRFDRKYPFDLPELPERKAYIDMWNSSLQSALRLPDEATHKLAELTEGFSFAYLKELFLSSMMRWISGKQQGTMAEMMIAQVNTLREQMVSALALEAEPPKEEQPSPRTFISRRNRYSKFLLFRHHLRLLSPDTQATIGE